MGTSVYFNNQGASREQFLVEDLVIESIKNHGIDVYYLPRDSRSSFDELFGDDPVKSYTSSYTMEMYLETFNDFEGNQEFFSKFGLEVQKNARVALARRTFERYVPTVLRNTPKEGDLIWLPVQRKLMEITFVEQEKNFFQLGKGARGGLDNRILPYMYVLELQLFKYNGEFLDTGIEEIDQLQNTNAIGVEFTMSPGGTGTYENFEVVYQGTSLETADAIAIVSRWDIPTRKLILRNIKGSFANSVAIKGTQSAASWSVQSSNDQEDANSNYDDNFRIEQEADNILDWTELNPFGSPNE